MSTTDPQDELTMLARARAGLSPSPADAHRVRAALTAALAAPDGARPDASAPGSDSGMGGGWSWRVLATSVAVTALGAGAAGYWLGHRAASREVRPVPAAAVTSVSVASSPPGPAAGAGAPSPAPSPAPPAGDAPSVRDAIRRRPVLGPRAARPEVITAPAESLAQEVRALRAVERALRDNDPRLALAILQQLDRDVPRGKLVEERRATSVMARCAAGDVPFGVNWAEDFASDYPDSVYRGRVEQSCERGGRGK